MSKSVQIAGWAECAGYACHAAKIADGAICCLRIAKFDLSDVNELVFIRLFLAGKVRGKAEKFFCILNMLDALQESLILVAP